MSRTSLLLGCGHSREKKLYSDDNPGWGHLVTLDMNKSVDPDVVWNLNDLPLPFEDEAFDEIAAYDVLEHVGRQGDWRGFFDEFEEYHRILKPGGLFSIIVPIGEDALADPGHTRFLHQNHFFFLTPGFYEDNLSQGAPVTDYRTYIRTWWSLDFIEKQGNHHLGVILRKIA